jgi:Putative restriction endonuclease
MATQTRGLICSPPVPLPGKLEDIPILYEDEFQEEMGASNPHVPEDTRSYTIGRDGPPPLATMEVLSQRSAQQRDLKEKMVVYAKLRVPEYLLVDLSGRFLPERLLLKRLQANGTYRDEKDKDGGVTSQLGFRLIIEADGQLTVVNARTDEDMYGRKRRKPRHGHLAGLRSRRNVRPTHVAQRRSRHNVRPTPAAQRRNRRNVRPTHAAAWRKNFGSWRRKSHGGTAPQNLDPRAKQFTSVILHPLRRDLCCMG